MAHDLALSASPRPPPLIMPSPSERNRALIEWEHSRRLIDWASRRESTRESRASSIFARPAPLGIWGATKFKFKFEFNLNPKIDFEIFEPPGSSSPPTSRYRSSSCGFEEDIGRGERRADAWQARLANLDPLSSPPTHFVAWKFACPAAPDLANLQIFRRPWFGFKSYYLAFSSAGPDLGLRLMRLPPFLSQSQGRPSWPPAESRAASGPMRWEKWRLHQAGSRLALLC